jgi:hypothetical protein
VEKLIGPLYEVVRPTIEEAHTAGIVHAPDAAVFFFMLACGTSIPLSGRGVVDILSGSERNGEGMARDLKASALSLIRRV